MVHSLASSCSFTTITFDARIATTLTTSNTASTAAFEVPVTVIDFATGAIFEAEAGKLSVCYC